MQSFTSVVEHCPVTGHYIGYVPGSRGARSQGETLEELNEHLMEVISTLLEDGAPPMKGTFIGIQVVMVA